MSVSREMTSSFLFLLCFNGEARPDEIRYPIGMIDCSHERAF